MAEREELRVFFKKGKVMSKQKASIASILKKTTTDVLPAKSLTSYPHGGGVSHFALGVQVSGVKGNVFNKSTQKGEARSKQ